MENNMIYLVTVCTHCVEDENTGCINLGSTRIWGWMPTLVEAQRVIENNISDIWEHYYDYAFIEEVPYGVPAYPIQTQWWYHWNDVENKYLPIENPVPAHALINSIG